MEQQKTFEKTYNLDLDTDEMSQIGPIADVKETILDNVDACDKKELFRRFSVKCMCIKNIRDYMWVQKFLNSLPKMPVVSTMDGGAPVPLIYLADKDIPGIMQEHVLDKKITTAMVSHENDKYYMCVDITARCCHDWFQIGEIEIIFPANACISDISMCYKIPKIADGADDTYSGEIPNCRIQKISDCHYKLGDNLWRFRRATGMNCDYSLKFATTTLDALPLRLSVRNLSITLAHNYLKVCTDMFEKISLKYTKDYIEITKYDGNDVLRHDIAKIS